MDYVFKCVTIHLSQQKKLKAARNKSGSAECRFSNSMVLQKTNAALKIYSLINYELVGFKYQKTPNDVK